MAYVLGFTNEAYFEHVHNTHSDVYIMISDDQSAAVALMMAKLSSIQLHAAVRAGAMANGIAGEGPSHHQV